MQHAETRTGDRRRPWSRIWNRKKASPRAVGPGSPPAGPTPLPNEVDDPFGEDARGFIEPGLRPEERLEAEREARRGLPATTAATPSDGELRLRERFLTALARLRRKGDEAYDALDRAQDQARHRAQDVATEARALRDSIRSFPEPPPECQEIDRLYRAAQDADAELAQFRRRRALSESATPRPPARWWWVWLAAVAFVETLANGILVHSGTTDGFLASWGFALLISAATVGGLGWLMSDLVFRRWRFGGLWKRLLLSGALLGSLVVFTATHFGFAHYRDAIVALADSGAADADFDLDGLDDLAVSDTRSTHPPAAPIGIGRAVLHELRAQFAFLGFSPPGWSVVVSHPSPLPDDHAADVVMEVMPGELGYEARGGELWRVRDERAGRFDEWESVLLLGVGLAALVFAVWKWYFRNEPIPDWDRLHRTAQTAHRKLDEEYRRELAETRRQETLHRKQLDAAESSLDALPRLLHRLHERRRHILGREAELLRETAEAGTAAVEDYRAANRAYRSVSSPPPRYWDVPWSPPERTRDRLATAVWDEDYEDGLHEVNEIVRRVAAENTAHAPAAEQAYRVLRGRLVQAARRSAPREGLTMSKTAQARVERMPPFEAEGQPSRLKAAS